MEKFEYGSKEELIHVSKVLRLGILDLMTGDRTPASFINLYWEFESFLFEHEYDVDIHEDEWDEIKAKIDNNFLEV